MILAALLAFALFDPSPTPGAVNVCTASLREMIPAVCSPEETPPCFQLGPLVPVECAVVVSESGGEMFAGADAAPGQALMWHLFAYEPEGGQTSGCAEPVTHDQTITFPMLSTTPVTRLGE